MGRLMAHLHAALAVWWSAIQRPGSIHAETELPVRKKWRLSCSRRCTTWTRNLERAIKKEKDDVRKKK